jgi:hypothetical protein
MTLRYHYNGVPLRHNPFFFRCPLAAQAWSDRTVKPSHVVLGEVGDVLVVCPADAARLERRGYEVVS